MRNILLKIEYDGSGFSGWQWQPGKRTVQGTIGDAVERIIGEKVSVIGASRTDAGVHALGQAANFVMQRKGAASSAPTCRKLLAALNGVLPGDVSVKAVREVPLSFRANRDAKKKTYSYLIWNAGTRSPLLRGRAWHVWRPLDLRGMRKGAKLLVGRHNFSAFRGARSDTKTAIRRIDRIDILTGPWFRRQSERTFPAALLCWRVQFVAQTGDSSVRGEQGDLIRITVAGGGFLKYMVRNIVGTLVAVGKGKLRPDDLKTILKSRDRRKAGVTAPANGLCLVSVDFDRQSANIGRIWRK